MGRSVFSNYKARFFIYISLVPFIGYFFVYINSRFDFIPLVPMLIILFVLSMISIFFCVNKLLKLSGESKPAGESGNLSNVGSVDSNIIRDIKEISSVFCFSTHEIGSSTTQISKGMEQVAQTISELANGATEQAASTDEGNMVISQILEGLEAILKDMENSEKLVDSTKRAVETAGESIEYQRTKMDESKQVIGNVTTDVTTLSNKSQEIGQITLAIKSIADQTNLLSLNAAIEAVRAGEQGKGFAVVAGEIKKLAEQATTSTKRITDIIHDVQVSIAHTVENILCIKKVVEEQETALEKTTVAFDEINDSVGTVTSNVKSVCISANILDTKAKHAGELINSISLVANETASSTQEIFASLEEQEAAVKLILECTNELAAMAGNLSGKMQSLENQ